MLKALKKHFTTFRKGVTDIILGVVFILSFGFMAGVILSATWRLFLFGWGLIS